MNLRTHKRMRYAQVSYILVNAYWQRVIDSAMEKAMAFTPAELAEQAARWDNLWKDLEKNMAKRQLVEDGFRGPDEFLEHDVDAAAKDEFLGTKKLYTVAKKSTGEIVARDLELDDAEEMILKAHKNKKAALVLA